MDFFFFLLPHPLFLFFSCAILSHSRHSRCAECEPEREAGKRVGGGGVEWPPLFFSTQAEEAANASFALMSDVFMRRLRCHLPRGSCEVALLRCNLLHDEVARERERKRERELSSSHICMQPCVPPTSARLRSAHHQPTPAGVASSALRLRNLHNGLVAGRVLAPQTFVKTSFPGFAGTPFPQ